MFHFLLWVLVKCSCRVPSSSFRPDDPEGCVLQLSGTLEDPLYFCVWLVLAQWCGVPKVWRGVLWSWLLSAVLSPVVVYAAPRWLVSLWSQCFVDDLWCLHHCVHLLYWVEFLCLWLPIWRVLCMLLSAGAESFFLILQMGVWCFHVYIFIKNVWMQVFINSIKKNYEHVKLHYPSEHSTCCYC